MKQQGRTLVIGDIHGGLRALEEVLVLCGYDKEYDKLIFLGDYVDGWSESAELVEFLLDIAKQAVYEPVFLRGNHDEWCTVWMNTGFAKREWLTQGGASTFESYAKMFEGKIPSEHVAFFYKLVNYYIDDQNRGFVHGGFSSKLGLGNDFHESTYYWDRDLWQLALLSNGRIHEGGSPQSRRFEQHKEIYIGHTTTRMWGVKPKYPEYNDPNQAKNGPITVPMNRCNIWNLDTGGGWGGKLTIMDIDTKEYWQSDFVKNLYPEEKGRT